MQAYFRRILAVLLLGVVLVGCNLPLSSYASGTPNPTDYVMTLSVMQTKAVMTATAEGVSGATREPTQAPIPQTGGTPGTQVVVVVNDTVCWRGPGPAYEIVSALFKGTQVQLIGRTVLPAWLIVLNPIYKDPCWAQASDLQVDQSLLANLPIYPIPVTGYVAPSTAVIQRSPTVTPLPPTATPLPPTVPVPTSTPVPPTPPPPTSTSVPAPTQPAPSPTAPAATATPASAPTATQAAPTSAPTTAATSTP